MSVKIEIMPTVNIWIEVKIGKLERGQSEEYRSAREVRGILRVGYYRICTDGSLIIDKALDLVTKAFTIDVVKDFAKIRKYSKNHPERKILKPEMTLDEVSVIPVYFHNRHNWCDGDFGLVCYRGIATHLVRIDNLNDKKPPTIKVAAQAAFDLLVA